MVVSATPKETNTIKSHIIFHAKRLDSESQSKARCASSSTWNRPEETNSNTSFEPCAESTNRNPSAWNVGNTTSETPCKLRIEYAQEVRCLEEL